MRRGRPRKPEDTAGMTWTMWQRLRDLSLEPKLETPVGRMTLLKELTQYQWDTAEKVAEIYSDFAQHHGLRRSAASPGFEVGRGHSPTYEDDEARDRAVAAKKAFDRLQDTLSHFPPGLRFALEELCVQKRACPAGYISKVKDALDVLAAWLGYKIRKKRLDISKRV